MWGTANINGCPAITELATKLQDLANVQITEGNMYIQTGLKHTIGEDKLFYA